MGAGVSTEVTAVIAVVAVLAVGVGGAALVRYLKNEDLEQQKREAERRYANDPAKLEEALYMINSQQGFAS